MYGPKWPCLLMYMSHEIDVGTGCSLGRAPRTKETLPDFHEVCRVSRHPRIFRRLTSCQRTPRFWGITKNKKIGSAFHSKKFLAKKTFIFSFHPNFTFIKIINIFIVLP